MEADFRGKYPGIFSRMINCEQAEGTESTSVGVTRMGELAEFVDMLMADRTEQIDRTLSGELAPVLAKLPADKRQAFLRQRFCTYTEFKQLHTTPKYNQPVAQDTIVFKLLGITDAIQQETCKKRFPPDREGYFKLMEVLQPQLRTFFFPAVQSLYPCC